MMRYYIQSISIFLIIQLGICISSEISASNLLEKSIKRLDGIDYSINVDLTTIKKLTFEKPDLLKFKCIDLAYQALESGGSSPAVLNIANDMVVNLFLSNKIDFIDIPRLINTTIEKHHYISEPTLDDIYSLMDWVPNFLNKELN